MVVGRPDPARKSPAGHKHEKSTVGTGTKSWGVGRTWALIFLGKARTTRLDPTRQTTLNLALATTARSGPTRKPVGLGRAWDLFLTFRPGPTRHDNMGLTRARLDRPTACGLNMKPNPARPTAIFRPKYICNIWKLSTWLLNFSNGNTANMT